MGSCGYWKHTHENVARFVKETTINVFNPEFYERRK